MKKFYWLKYKKNHFGSTPAVYETPVFLKTLDPAINFNERKGPPGRDSPKKIQKQLLLKCSVRVKILQLSNKSAEKSGA